MTPKFAIAKETNFTKNILTNQKHGQQRGEPLLQNTQTFQREASAAHESMPKKIQPDLRRSCGRASDQTVKRRSTRGTQKRNEEGICTGMGAGCASYSETFLPCQLMQQNNLDFDFQNSISTEKQEAGVAFEFVRLTACASAARGASEASGACRLEARVSRRFCQTPIPE